MLRCEIKASNSALTKHWLEVIGQVSFACQHTDSLERLLDSLTQWRIDRGKGKRDSVAMPGQYAQFTIEGNEMRVYKISQTSEKRKLMAVAIREVQQP